jgi:hypothetical protein
MDVDQSIYIIIGSVIASLPDMIPSKSCSAITLICRKLRAISDPHMDKRKSKAGMFWYFGKVQYRSQMHSYKKYRSIHNRFVSNSMPIQWHKCRLFG